MRKIKFRAKMTGFQLNVFGTPGNVYQDKDSNNEWFDSIFFQDENGNKCQEYIDCHTLSQFTGLTDKNGVEIYENDIIRRSLSGANPTTIDKVYFHNGCYVIGNGEFIKPLSNYCTLEVLGNIFDNPERL